MTNYRAEVATLPSAVYVWMWFMRAVLIGGGLAFIGTRAGRIVFLLMVLTVLGLWIGKGLWPDMPLGLLGSGLHLVLWVPMAAWVFLYLRAKPDGAELSLYRRLSYWWGGLVLIVVGISLIFDVRELIAIAAAP